MKPAQLITLRVAGINANERPGQLGTGIKPTLHECFGRSTTSLTSALHLCFDTCIFEVRRASIMTVSLRVIMYCQPDALSV